MSVVLDILDGTEDLSRFKHPLTYNGKMIVGNKMKFNGIDASINCGKRSSLNNRSALFLACWINIISASDYDSIFYRVNNQYETYILDEAGASWSANFHFRINSVNETAVIKTGLIYGTWYYWVVVYDDPYIIGYINGNEEIKYLTGGGDLIDVSASDLLLMENSGISTFSNGFLKDVKQDNDILIPNYIKDYYEKTEKFY